MLICKLIGVHFKVEGVGYINKHEPSIFIINHQSCLDGAGEKYLLSFYFILFMPKVPSSRKENADSEWKRQCHDAIFRDLHKLYLRHRLLFH